MKPNKITFIAVSVFVFVHRLNCTGYVGNTALRTMVSVFELDGSHVFKSAKFVQSQFLSLVDILKLFGNDNQLINNCKVCDDHVKTYPVLDP